MTSCTKEGKLLLPRKRPERMAMHMHTHAVVHMVSPLGYLVCPGNLWCRIASLPFHEPLPPKRLGISAFPAIYTRAARVPTST